MLNFLILKLNSGRMLTTRSLIAVPLLLSASAMATSNPSEEEVAFNNEVLECASYYQISSNAIASMNAPQMKAVGDRLLNSSVQAIELAEQYQNKDVVASSLLQIKEQQLASLPNNKSLGSLMGKYKVACKSLLAEPQKRLDYWIMATM
ncbi:MULTISPECIES: hypothetical protein [unclassified Shewanella]|uniref:hypothetical protein n=1 Tax=unclassified Shewanella TaxID=196818 RepID=UPI003FA3C585